MVHILFPELFNLITLSSKGLHNPDTGQVFLKCRMKPESDSSTSLKVFLTLVKKIMEVIKIKGTTQREYRVSFTLILSIVISVMITVNRISPTWGIWFAMYLRTVSTSVVLRCNKSPVWDLMCSLYSICCKWSYMVSLIFLAAFSVLMEIQRPLKYWNRPDIRVNKTYINPNIQSFPPVLPFLRNS